MSGYGHGEGDDLSFIDPISRRVCTLVAPPDGRIFPSGDDPKIGIIHPDCDQLADVSPDLDCFYCETCQWNGRVSGAWVVDVIEGTVER
jgi:hypothetical protein